MTRPPEVWWVEFRWSSTDDGWFAISPVAHIEEWILQRLAIYGDPEFVSANEVRWAKGRRVQVRAVKRSQ